MASSTALPVWEYGPDPRLNEGDGVVDGPAVAVGAAKTRPLLVMAFKAGSGVGTFAVGVAESVTEASLGARVRATFLLARVY